VAVSLLLILGPTIWMLDRPFNERGAAIEQIRMRAATLR
jgi:hypothetical protein